MALTLAPALEPPSERGLELVPEQRRLGVEMLAGRHVGAQLSPPNAVELGVTQSAPLGVLLGLAPAIETVALKRTPQSSTEGRLTVESQAE